jgi:hypothetical protein
MRTRFLATDYFEPPPADASSDQAVALAALPFPSLPVPTFPPDPYLPDPDLLPAGNDLDSFPVASALSEFLDAVVPRPLPLPDIPDTDEVSPPHLRGFPFSGRVGSVGELLGLPFRGGLCGFVEFRGSALESCGISELQWLGCFTQGVDDYLYGRSGNDTGSSWTDPVACGVSKASEALCLDSVHFWEMIFSPSYVAFLKQFCLLFKGLGEISDGNCEKEEGTKV